MFHCVLRYIFQYHVFSNRCQQPMHNFLYDLDFPLFRRHV
jgi:hypothetical protein